MRRDILMLMMIQVCSSFSLRILIRLENIQKKESLSIGGHGTDRMREETNQRAVGPIFKAQRESA